MTMTWEMFSTRRVGRTVLMTVFAAVLLGVGGCKSANPEYAYPEQVGGSDQHDPTGRSTNSDEQVGSLLDDDGLIGGLLDRDKEDEASKGDKEDEALKGDEEGAAAGTAEEKTEEKVEKTAERRDKKGAPAGGTLNVNGYLWRASLETLSFMPLSSADPYGGVIITDWHVNPQAPNERFKLTVYVLDKELRADGIRVSVFREVRSEAGNWVSQPASDTTRIEIENAILTRARQLRVAQLNED